MTDVRTELSLIQKHVRQHNREAGESVMWYEFSPFADTPAEGSTYDDIYDEGAPGEGGRSYLSGFVIPTIYVMEVEDTFVSEDFGRQPTQNIMVTFLYDDAIRAGMTEPREYKPHLNDLFLYDSRWYKVNEFRVRGRLIDQEVIVRVQGYEVFIDQEFGFDNSPAESSFDVLWPPSFPAI